MAWLSGWGMRKKITLTGGASGAQTAFQLKLAVAYDSDMQADFDDLRFTQSDETTLIDAWLETKTDSVSATVWVEFPTTPVNGATEDYYMYYGNSGAASDWDIRATMLDGDDFLGSSLDSAIWDDQYCTIAVSGGELTLSTFTSGTYRYCAGIRGKRLINASSVFECRCKSVYASDDSWFGLANQWVTPTDDAQNARYVYNNGQRGYNYNEGAVGYSDAISWTANTYYKQKVVNTGSGVNYYRDGTILSGCPVTTNVPDEQMYLRITGDYYHSPTVVIDWIFVRKYAASPATYVFGSEETPGAAGQNMIVRWGGIPGMRYNGRNSW